MLDVLLLRDIKHGGDPAQAQDVAARVPAAEPALDAYAATIDGWRDDLQRGIESFRPADRSGAGSEGG